MVQSKGKLDKKKIEHFKKLLMQLKSNISKDIQQMNEESAQSQESRDVSGHVLHMADVATDMYDREFNMSLADNERDLLQKIDDALKRIEEGTYGICLGTGKPIALQRLEAIPYAEYCLEHQEKIENEK